MANRYTLRYLPAAVDDLISIFDWIANDSPANGAVFIDKLDYTSVAYELTHCLAEHQEMKNS